MSQQHRKGLAEVLHQARLFITLLLGGLLGVFALQNMATVELTFVFWTFESRRIIVIAVSLIVGLIIGWFYGYSARRSARHDEQS
jgi:uncharacterized integral membrane protein